MTVSFTKCAMYNKRLLTVGKLRKNRNDVIFFSIAHRKCDRSGRFGWIECKPKQTIAALVEFDSILCGRCVNYIQFRYWPQPYIYPMNQWNISFKWPAIKCCVRSLTLYTKLCVFEMLKAVYSVLNLVHYDFWIRIKTKLKLISSFKIKHTHRVSEIKK